MISILGIFCKSPFIHFKEHMRQVKECVDGVIPLINALLNGDHEGVEKEAKKIGKLEHKADVIKDHIRDKLPRNILMPVERGDLLLVLASQDDICDAAEDLGVLLMLKRLKVPEELKADIKILVDKVMKACNQAYTIMEQIDDLVETSFRGFKAEKVLSMINELGVMEWESDCIQFSLAKKLLGMEKELTPVEIFMWMKVIEKIGDLANKAESMGNKLRLMLSKS